MGSDLAVAVLDEAASFGVRVARLITILTVEHPLSAVMACARLHEVHCIAPPSWRQGVSACFQAWLEAP